VVLSELAEVPVLVEWGNVTWRVRWVDGPTRVQLVDLATALDGYAIGAPLLVTQMRFARRSSSAATAVCWLAHGSLGGTAALHDDLCCADTAYPQRRAGPELLAAAVVLAAVSRATPAFWPRRCPPLSPHWHRPP
jgi:hypothetical protein